MKRKTDIRVHTRVLYIRIFSSYATARQAKTHRVTAKTKRDWLWSKSDEEEKERKREETQRFPSSNVRPCVERDGTIHP